MPNDDDDFYSQRDMPEDKSSEDESSDEDMDEQKTALLPKSIFKGKDCKPGDMVEMKVVHVYDDEVEVAYTGKYKHKSDMRKRMMEESEREMDSMATES